MTDPNQPSAGRAPAALDRVLLVTGPSGAGRITAIRALEDLGYEVIDNLPLSLVPRLIDGPPHARPIALGVDTRNRDFSNAALKSLVDGSPGKYEILYLDCSEEVLLRRYSETRRRHPLAPHDAPAAGISRDKEMLRSIRARADILIDTSSLSPHDLRADIERWFSRTDDDGLAVALHSFSYKRGLPQGLDLVFDVRFLRNPHWEPALRHLDGRNPDVARFVEQDEHFREFFARLMSLIELMLPAFVAEGKAHLSVGVGCTGGQHRSVAVTERLGNRLADAGWQVSKRHRELERRLGHEVSRQAET